jgi:cytochrome oxidase Cu insertion factor (SCO1/SenC/PrrC family)/thiol-disulfide isomerase/thioredoxin
MTRRQLLRALIGASAALLIAASIASSLIGTAPPRTTAAPRASQGVRLAVGSLLDRPVPTFALRDEHGRRVSLRDYRGRYLILSPSMTLCHEVCPMTTAVLEQIESTIRRDGLAGQIAVAEATVDPWRDSPARLRAYRRMAGVHFDTLTGAPAQIRRLWRFFGIYYKRVPQASPPDVDWLTHRPERFDVEHTDALLVLDPRGHLRVASLGMPSTAGALPHALRELLNDQGRRNLRHPDEPWTAGQAMADVLALRRHDGSSDAPPAAPALSIDGARASLRGSPRPLAELHAQAGRLIDAAPSAFRARLTALRGRPVVVNEWASWCGPCRIEFPLLARASTRYGRRVGFIGVDVNDNAAQARTFLMQRPVSYPSYADPDSTIARGLGSSQGLPTTVFIAADGRRLYTQVGYYATMAQLDADIQRYAVGH